MNCRNKRNLVIKQKQRKHQLAARNYCCKNYTNDLFHVHPGLAMGLVPQDALDKNQLHPPPQTPNQHPPRKKEGKQKPHPSRKKNKRNQETPESPHSIGDIMFPSLYPCFSAIGANANRCTTYRPLAHIATAKAGSAA